tara:strand:+ start:48360 stop:48491 length:132 start_codon:yes stop_codon:yes gene_type:complete
MENIWPETIIFDNALSGVFVGRATHRDMVAHAFPPFYQQMIYF